MSTDESVMVLNMSDLDTKRKLMSKVGALKGVWEVSLKPRKRKRSSDANAYYWAAVLTPFLEWLRESEGDYSIDKEQAHTILKCVVLGTKSVVMPGTGEVVEMPPRTRSMKSDEFARFVEAAAKWMAEFCGIVVMTADVYHGKE